MFNIKISFILYCTLLFGNVSWAQFSLDSLRSGDLMFEGVGKSDFSSAINEVTQTQKQTQYSHIGMLFWENRQLFLLHAAPKNGVEKILFIDYIQASDSLAKFDFYRIKGIDSMDVNLVQQTGETMLGQPYNFSYIMNDSSHYCSEFVYLCFKPYHVFDLNPMTFKKEMNGDFLPFWQEYYQKLGIAIPEGLPGCNPNGMAESENLFYLFSYPSYYSRK